MSEITLKVRLETIIFHNPDNQYVVAEFSETETYHYFTATGHIFQPQEDQMYQISGQYVSHPRYGKQFKIETIEKLLPNNNEAVVRFLCSDAFPSIGKKTAQQIVETLGDDCLNQIREDRHVLDRVPRLNQKKKEILFQGIQSFEGFNDTYATLIGYGLSANQIALLQKEYDDVLAVLNRNCFLPYYEIYGFGYKSATKIADAMQLDNQDPRRFDAYLYETIRTLCMRSGDTYVHLQTLLQHFHQVDPAQIQDSLARLEDVDSMHMESQKIYPFSLYDDEKTIAEKILQHNFPIETVPPEDLADAIRDVEFDNAIEYDIHQKEAIETFFAHSMMIINGGPGTGKTTIIKGILKMCETFYPTANIQLCAPTGRATNRMSQLSSYNARTIHSLLKWNMEDNSFGANEQEPLDCDFLVVDECSMVDTHLFASLLKALPIHCRIILIGDEDQLESVGPGKVFQDLLDADICPSIHLEKIYRQKEGSGIVQMAQQIRLEQPLTYTNGVTFMQQESNTIAQNILNLAQYQDMDDCQILAPMYKGIAGIDLINTEMQKVLNPPSQGKAEIRIGTTVFRVQDKVMLLKNMPEQDVYNGDIGTLLEIKKEKNEIRLIVDFDGHLVEITHDILYYLKHAYCISIHKSQGSEYDRVICIVDPGATGMYNKRLLYTAVSRAKKDLVLIGNRALFENSVRLKQRHIRQTTLISMIHQNRQE